MKLDFDIIYAYDWLTALAGIEIKKIYKKPLGCSFSFFSI